MTLKEELLKSRSLLCMLLATLWFGVDCARAQGKPEQRSGVPSESHATADTLEHYATRGSEDDNIDLRYDTAVLLDTLWERLSNATEMQDYAQMQQLLDSLAKYMHSSNDSLMLLQYFIARGEACYALGQVANALQAYRSAVAVQTKDPSWNTFTAYASLGIIYAEYQYYPEALRNFEKADSVLFARGNNNGRSFLFQNMSEIFLRQGQNREALYACYDALLYLDVRYVALEVMIHVNMATAYARVGRKELMRVHADYALKYVRTYGDDALRKEVYILLAKAWQDCGDDARTDELLRAQEQLTQKPPQDIVYRTLLKMKAQRLEAKGDYANAQRALEAYLRYDDSTRRLLGQVDFAEAATTDALLSMRDQQQRHLDLLEETNSLRQRSYRRVTLLMVSVFMVTIGAWLTMRSMRAQHVQSLAGIQAMADRLSVVNASVEHRQQQLVRQQQQVQQQQQVLELSQRILRHFGQKLRGDLRYVSNLQNTLLPSAERLRDVFGESFAFYMPRDVVSGDFYSCAEVGEVKILAVFDCAGHGIPGALMSFVGNILMRKVVLEEKQDDPALILTRLHELVRQYLRSDDDCVVGFYTMDVSVAAWHARQNRLVISSASRTAYLFNEGEMHSYRGVLMSVGSLLLERTFFNDEVILSAPATLYLASDGYSDQMDKNNRKYGRQRFVQFLEEGVALPMQQQLSRLSSEFVRYKGDAMQTDDVCVLAVRLETSEKEVQQSKSEEETEFISKTDETQGAEREGGTRAFSRSFSKESDLKRVYGKRHCEPSVFQRFRLGEGLA